MRNIIESLINTRDKFVKIRIVSKNKIHTILFGQSILVKGKGYKKY